MRSQSRTTHCLFHNITFVRHSFLNDVVFSLSVSARYSAQQSVTDVLAELDFLTSSRPVFIFFLRGVMLARYMVWHVSVYLSVCHKNS